MSANVEPGKDESGRSDAGAHPELVAMQNGVGGSTPGQSFGMDHGFVNGVSGGLNGVGAAAQSAASGVTPAAVGGVITPLGALGAPVYGPAIAGAIGSVVTSTVTTGAGYLMTGVATTTAQTLARVVDGG